MRNLFVDDGKLQSVNGYSLLGSSMVLQRITGIFPYYLEDGRKFFLVTDSSITLETQDFNSWTFISSNSNTSGLLMWKQVRNKMWGYNGINSVMTWDHSVKTILDGDNGTPNVPKFRHMEYYQDKVWGLGVPNANSDLYYSATITTDNVIIAPDDKRAWPAINLLHVGQGDGESGTALFTYNGRLRVGKERSLYTIQGDLPSSYIPIKTDGQIGVVSNESVVLLDGTVYYMGNDGIYQETNRISDLIGPDVDVMKKGQSSIISNNWDAQPEFARGHFFGSTATIYGLVQPLTQTKQINGLALYYGGNALFTLNAGTTFYGYKSLDLLRDGSAPTGDTNGTSPDVITQEDRVFVRGTDVSCSQNSVQADGGNPIVKMWFQNTYTGEETSVNTPIQIAGGQSNIYPNQNPIFDYFQIRGGSMAIRFELLTYATGSAVTCQASLANLRLAPATTVQYISDVSTLASVTAWGNFDAVYNANGGKIEFFYHTSTSVVNITTQTWKPIAPGAIINEPMINNFIQWSSTITSVSSFTQSCSNIDNVTITHIEGQSSIQRPIALGWKNRYWLSVSTISDTAKRVIYVKSKITNKNPNAWMPIDGVNMCAIAKSGEFLYAGSCSTGIIYRLDYGQNFDGHPIASTYNLPRLNFGSDFFDKNIHRFWVYGEKNIDGIIRVNSSIDEGSITTSTFSINGSGLYNKTINTIYGGGKNFDFSISENDLDQPMVLHNFSILWSPTMAIQDK